MAEEAEADRLKRRHQNPLPGFFDAVTHEVPRAGEERERERDKKHSMSLSLSIPCSFLTACLWSSSPRPPCRRLFSALPQEVDDPHVSPWGHVLGKRTWINVLTNPHTKNVCPLTRNTVHLRQLVRLTHENIEEHRAKIIDLVGKKA